jgi:hypothetical protein
MLHLQFDDAPLYVFRRCFGHFVKIKTKKSQFHRETMYACNNNLFANSFLMHSLIYPDV